MRCPADVCESVVPAEPSVYLFFPINLDLFLIEKPVESAIQGACRKAYTAVREFLCPLDDPVSVERSVEQGGQ
jgi:hypothetical protein